jgi:hypothetical protein
MLSEAKQPELFCYKPFRSIDSGRDDLLFYAQIDRAGGMP